MSSLKFVSARPDHPDRYNDMTLGNFKWTILVIV